MGKPKKESNWIYNLVLLGVFIPVAILMFSGKDKDGRGLGDLFSSPGFPTFFFIALLIIGALIYMNVSYKKSNEKWNSGVFRNDQGFSEDSLLQSYIRLGALMLRQDTSDLKGKLGYLHRYFERHFENSYAKDLSTSLNGAFHNPVDLKIITPWLRTNLRSNSQRSQLLYFLAGLASVDGSINPREKRFLLQVAEQLDITRKDYDSIMAMYTKYEDAFNREQQQHSRRRTASSKPRGQYKREKAAKVLGISVNASIDEIKKAYRSLAKVHHPDRFAGESESQQKIAEERFIKIQLAYEQLLEYKN
ncbi:MAG: DnaJ domain-containing protein [Crocinitomicaceae bacterium]|nr:DnaJ domain-containing protein [Crocinitomicaceae bacterium]